MIPENPTEAEAKAALMAVPSGVTRARQVMAAIKHPQAGFVTWDYSAPRGITWREHRETFIDGVHTGLRFCGTDTRDEWLLVGGLGLSVLRALNVFWPVPPVEIESLLYIGTLEGTADVYTIVRNSQYIPDEDFYTGVNMACARGVIQNAPISVNVKFDEQGQPIRPPREVDPAMMPDPAVDANDDCECGEDEPPPPPPRRRPARRPLNDLIDEDEDGLI